jgi:hypothetical protein
MFYLTPEAIDTAGFAFVLLCLVFVITSVVAVAVGAFE